jgi:hypothetical protein
MPSTHASTEPSGARLALQEIVALPPIAEASIAIERLTRS